MIKPLLPCTNDQASQWMHAARHFLRSTGTGEHYSSAMGTATVAIAEYIAYTEGYTMRERAQ